MVKKVVTLSSYSSLGRGRATRSRRGNYHLEMGSYLCILERAVQDLSTCAQDAGVTVLLLTQLFQKCVFGSRPLAGLPDTDTTH